MTNLPAHHDSARHVTLADGTRLFVDQRGTGVPMLLVHGFPLDHSMWDEQLAALAADARLIVPDLRGFGRSSVTPGTLTMAQMADDLAALLDALEIQEPVIFCGLSMGGYVAWQFAKHYPERLAKLILCDTRAAADTTEGAAGRHRLAELVLQAGTESVAEAMLPKLFGPDVYQSKRELVGDLKRVILDTAPEGVAAALRGMAERPDMRSWLGELRVPTLLLVGEYDVISPPEEMRAMAEAIRGAQLHVIPGAGHMSPLEAPAEVNPILGDFIRRG